MKKDENEHSVIPEIEFLFASDFYNTDDSRYELTELYKDMIEAEYGGRPYNCKIVIMDGFHNVFVYFYDIRKVPWKYGVPYPLPIIGVEDMYGERFKQLYFEALSQRPVAELVGMRLNPNGVFIEDFMRCARAFYLVKAEEAVYDYLKSSHPSVTLAIQYGSALYLFFRHVEDIERYRKGEFADAFVESIRRIIKQFDTDDVWGDETPYIEFDDFANYDGVGYHHYFS